MNPGLRQLASACGIQTSYQDMEGRTHVASPETLVALLELWGVSARNPRAIKHALQAIQEAQASQVLPPVLVPWDHQPLNVELKFPPGQRTTDAYCELQLEHGGSQALPVAAGKASLPPLPFGYHHLRLELKGRVYETLLISSPSHSYSPPGELSAWGAFIPLYALHSEKSWGSGNLSDFHRLSRFIGSVGGETIATLPLMAAFLDAPVCDPSPYSPASRLFWNEFYLDMTAVPEFGRCGAARKLVSSAAFKAQVAAFQGAALIDYHSQAALRRQVLGLLAKTFFRQSNARTKQFEEFVKQRPRATDYAEFRATCDSRRAPWSAWPGRLSGGKLNKTDHAESDKQYYLYTQWVAEEQVCKLAGKCRAAGTGLGLDLPLGVHPDSYDVWRERDIFATGASVGAPPDLFFTKGQNWGFPPLHPQRLRERGYAYWAEFLRFQLRHARLIRIDHVMGLHRLFWIPPGLAAEQGTYVSYPAEEFHAILCLESHRHKTIIQGENLGTVPPEVNQAMGRHRFRQTYVLQFEQKADPKAALTPPPGQSVASLNTHDLPTFAAHWQGQDLEERAALGLATAKQLAEERGQRARVKAAVAEFLRSKNSPKSALRACLRWLAASAAELVLVNLEDLWLEERPQNVPGTSTERPNWRRKSRLSLEQIEQSSELRELLSAINSLRRAKNRTQQARPRAPATTTKH